MEHIEQSTESPNEFPHAHRGEAAINVFAVIGFVALLIIGLWAAITLFDRGVRLLSSAPANSFSPLGSLFSHSIHASVESDELTSGTPTTLSWNESSDVSDVETLSYPCRQGLLIKVNPSEDSSFAIPCNAPYELPNDVYTITVTPMLSTTSTIYLPLTVQRTHGKDVSRDSIDITVSPGSVAQHTPTTVKKAQPAKEIAKALPPVTAKAPTVEKTPKMPVSNVKSAQPTSATQSKSDLSVRILSVGSATNGVFAKQTTFKTSEIGSITFEVINTGAATASDWVFSAVLPTGSGYLYTSTPQKSLDPGSKATLTMNFDQMTAGAHTITITIDPNKRINEVREDNNAASTQILVR